MSMQNSNSNSMLFLVLLGLWLLLDVFLPHQMPVQERRIWMVGGFVVMAVISAVSFYGVRS